MSYFAVDCVSHLQKVENDVLYQMLCMVETVIFATSWPSATDITFFVKSAWVCQYGKGSPHQEWLQSKRVNFLIWAWTPVILPLVSVLCAISSASIQVLCKIAHFEQMDTRDWARTVQCVGHSTCKPRLWHSLHANFRMINISSWRGEYLTSLVISWAVSMVLYIMFVCLITSLTARLMEWP